MKNISNILGRGNLTPRERYLLLIHNDIQRTKTGKEVLTEADKAALENWKSTTNEEAREWNQLNAGWKLSGRMDIEAEFVYQDARAAYLAQKPILLEMVMYSLNRQANLHLKNLDRIKKVSMEQAVEIARKQKDIKLKEGLDFDYAVYQLAFELLSAEDQEEMNDLYPDIETDHQYLDQEEIIAHLFDGKKELSEEAKDKLAALVAEQSYNKFAKEYQLFHYFACIPLLEVARYFLKGHGVEIDGEQIDEGKEDEKEQASIHDTVTAAMHKYASEHNTDVASMLREGCRAWLDEDLFEDYKPLVISDSSELLGRWLESKIKARKTLNGYIASGELALRGRTAEETRKEKLYSKRLIDAELEATREIFESLGKEGMPKDEIAEKAGFETFNDNVITGESLYTFKGDYKFVNDFKKRTDTYDANLGLVYADNDTRHEGEHLDRELLVCQLDNKGEPVIFSQFGMSMQVLTRFLNSMALFEEVTKDGKTFIKFKNIDIAEVFKTHRQILIDNYATLLGFEVVFKKLSPFYDADMSDHVSGRLAVLREYIKEINKAISTITNTDEDSKKNRKSWLWKKDPIQFEDDMLIDIESIQPDPKTVSENEERVKEVFPGI